MKQLKVIWYRIRTVLTKTMGVIGMVIGYAQLHQAEWVQFISESRRGTVVFWIGVATFLLGLYNSVSPPQHPDDSDPKPPEA